MRELKLAIILGATHLLVGFFCAGIAGMIGYMAGQADAERGFVVSPQTFGDALDGLQRRLEHDRECRFRATREETRACLQERAQ